MNGVSCVNVLVSPESTLLTKALPTLCAGWILPVWIHACRWRWLCQGKCFPHCEQSYSFTPVWMRWCFLRWPLSVQLVPQPEQWYIWKTWENYLVTQFPIMSLRGYGIVIGHISCNTGITTKSPHLKPLKLHSMLYFMPCKNFKLPYPHCSKNVYR